MLQVLERLRILNERRPRICRDMKAWLARVNSEACRVIQLSEPVNRHLPLNPYQESADDFASYTNDRTNEVFLGIVKEAKVCGLQGLIQLPDGQFAWDYLTHDERRIRESDFYRRRFRRGIHKRKMRGDFFLLSGLWSTAYYHWMHDALQRLYRHDEWLPSCVKCIVPAEIDPKYLRCLTALGIATERIFHQPADEVWQTERLWFSPPPVPTGRSASASATWLRTTLLRGMATNNNKAPDLKLYVSRRNATSRRLLNEKVLMGLLERHGFKEVICENLSIDETAQLFAQAKVVLGPHGAGLANLLFCRPATQVLELFPGQVSARICYWTLSEALGHRYAYLQALRVNDSDDMTIAPENLLAGLAALDTP